MNQATRNHFVFVARCGCPTGLVEQSRECLTADNAWDDMYETRGQERDARSRGVRVELVDHAAYVREFYPLMTKGCAH
jgi:hypothetical protein